MKIKIAAAVAVTAAGLAGCGQHYFGPPAHRAAASPAATTAAPPQPAPVDTSATLTASCLTGVENMTTSGRQRQRAVQRLHDQRWRGLRHRRHHLPV